MTAGAARGPDVCLAKGSERDTRERSSVTGHAARAPQGALDGASDSRYIRGLVSLPRTPEVGMSASIQRLARFAFLVALVGIARSHRADAQAADATASADRAAGLRVVKAIHARYPFLHVMEFGGMTDQPSIVFAMPFSVWRALSAHERGALITYMAAMPAAARATPERFIDTPRDAPAYGLILRNVRSIPDGAWQIFVGRPVRAHGRVVDLETDSTVACGPAIAGCPSRY